MRVEHLVLKHSRENLHEVCALVRLSESESVNQRLRLVAGRRDRVAETSALLNLSLFSYIQATQCVGTIKIMNKL